MSVILAAILLVLFCLIELGVRWRRHNRTNKYGNEDFGPFGRKVFVRSIEFCCRILQAVCFIAASILFFHYIRPDEVESALNLIYQAYVWIRANA